MFWNNLTSWNKTNCVDGSHILWLLKLWCVLEPNIKDGGETTFEVQTMVCRWVSYLMVAKTTIICTSMKRELSSIELYPSIKGMIRIRYCNNNPKSRTKKQKAGTEKKKDVATNYAIPNFVRIRVIQFFELKIKTGHAKMKHLHSNV